ncbi:MAG: biopolymer transporter ExbD [Myxococcota bacterium]
MAFELERPRRPEPSINLSALIDIVFILMIFVILGATFDRMRAIGIDLPESSVTQQAPETPVIIKTTADGTLFLNEEAVAEEGLGAALRAARAQSESLVIQADASVPVQRAVDLLDAAREAGFVDASISTLPRRGAR